MRKSAASNLKRISLLITLFVVAAILYSLWFCSPYISFIMRNGLVRVLLYPTDTLVKNNKKIITITLHGTGTTVVQYDIQNKKITLMTSGKTFADTNKGAGYYVIFDDTTQTEVERVRSIINKLSDIRFILTRDTYIGYVQYLESSIRKNLSLVQLLALWRTYTLHQSQFAIVQQ